ncbi:MAG: hypothetical protein COB85_09600, partial [Bacteroidetes bacterium]
MADNQNIDKKIRESFEDARASAPDGLWDDISSKMETSGVDNNLDEKVRDSFNNMSESAPEGIWTGVNRQLNIDRVWKRISGKLDRRAIMLWRRLAGSVAVLLLLIGWGGYQYLGGVQEPLIVELQNTDAQEDNKLAKENAKTIPVQNEIKSAEKAEFLELNQENGSELFDDSGINERITNSTDGSGNKIENLGENRGEPEKPSFEEPIGGSYMDEASAVDMSITTMLSKEEEEREDALSLSTIVINSLMEIIAISPLLALSDADRELNELRPDDYYSDEVKVKKRRFEVGMTYSLNNTWLLNNETKNSFDKNSLITTKVAFASSFGFVVNYNLTA